MLNLKRCKPERKYEATNSGDNFVSTNDFSNGTQPLPRNCIASLIESHPRDISE